MAMGEVSVRGNGYLVGTRKKKREISRAKSSAMGYLEKMRDEL